MDLRSFDIIIGDGTNTYEVCEEIQPGWTFAYSCFGQCSAGEQLTPNANSNDDQVCVDIGPLSGINPDFTLFFGNLPPGKVTIIKAVEGDAPEQEFDFITDLPEGNGNNNNLMLTTIMDGTEFTLADGDDKEFLDVPAGDYFIGEFVPNLWTLDDIECVSEGDSSFTRNGDDFLRTVIINNGDYDMPEGGVLTLAPGDEVTCTFTNRFDDGDGIDDEIEDGAPNDGDGNYDGTPDKFQPDVTSLPSAIGGCFFTVEVDFGNGEWQNSAVSASATANGTPASREHPCGFVTFTTTAPDVGDNNNLITASLEGPLTEPVNIRIFVFSDDTSLIQSLQGATKVVNGTTADVDIGLFNANTVLIEYEILDNGAFDSNPAFGVITDPIGPFRELTPFAPGEPTPIPTTNLYGLLTMIGLLALITGWHQRRRRLG